MEGLRKTESIITALLSLLLGVGAVVGQPPTWFSKLNRVHPLESTRPEVEQLFGFSKVNQTRTGRGGQTIDYEFELGRFEVSYSTGKCSPENNTRGYNVEKNVVRALNVHLFQPIRIAELGLDLERFEKYIEPESNAWIYSNDNLGLKYTGDKETITSINIDPPEKYDHLLCKNLLPSSAR